MIDNEGFSALHRSAQSGVYELVKFFADKGGDIHLKTKVGGDCFYIFYLKEVEFIVKQRTWKMSYICLLCMAILIFANAFWTISPTIIKTTTPERGIC